MTVGRLRFVRTSIAKDLRRRLADPMSIALWLSIPLLLGGLMSLISGPDAAPRAHVLVADLDDTLLSRLLAGSGTGAPEMPFNFERVELEEGRARMEAGEASALLVLPEGFALGVLREEPVRLELVTNPSQSIAPEMVRTALEIAVEAVFYAHRLLGEPLREIAAGPAGEAEFFDDLRVAELAARINERVRALETTLFPPVLRLELEGGDEDGEQGVDFGAFFLPGLLFMTLVFIAQGVSEDLWIEKDQGTLRRALISPQGLAPFLAGKLGAGAIVLAAASLLGLCIAATFFGLAWRNLPLALAWCAFGGVVLWCLFVLLQLLASSQRAANVLCLSILFPLTMIGGCFFPFEAMPDWMARIGRWTPNGRGVLVLRQMMFGGVGAADLLAGALVVALPGLAAFLLALRLLRTRFLAR